MLSLRGSGDRRNKDLIKELLLSRVPSGASTTNHKYFAMFSGTHKVVDDLSRRNR